HLRRRERDRQANNGVIAGEDNWWRGAGVISQTDKQSGGLRCLSARSSLFTESRILSRQFPWCTEISQGGSEIGPAVRPCLGAAVIHGFGRLPPNHSSTNDCPSGRGPAGSRNRAHSPSQPWRGRSGEGSLPLLLPERLRHRSALL